MKKPFSLLIYILVLIPSLSFALETGGNSGTYLRLSEDISGDKVYTLYEYLDLYAIGNGVSFYSSGWLRTDLEGRSRTDDTNKELRHAYLGLRGNSSFLDIGRLYVFEGVALEQVDGIYGGLSYKDRVGVSVFGGSPMETGRDTRRGDIIYGGRLWQGVSGYYRVGVSYLKEKNNDEDIREESGADIYIRPLKSIEVSGKSFYNNLSSKWMEHSYLLTLSPYKSLRLLGEVRSIDYSAYFQSPSVSAFTAPFIEPDERLLTLGGILEASITENTIISLDYKNYNYEKSGSANYYGGSIRYSTKSGGVGLSGHRMQAEEEDLRFGEYRAYVFGNRGRTDLSLDILYISYDKDINGESGALTVVASLGYKLTKSTKVAGDIEYSKNPRFDEELRGTLKLLYSFRTGGRDEK